VVVFSTPFWGQFSYLVRIVGAKKSKAKRILRHFWELACFAVVQALFGPGVHIHA